MASTPAFASTPKTGVVSIGTADTSRTAPTNVGTVFSAAVQGSRIDEVVVTAAGTTTTGIVRLFIYNGSTYFLLREILITGITASSSATSFTQTLGFNNFVLPNGYSLRATTNNSETFHVTAFGGDF
jgi:hypothetical protein